MPQTYAWIDFLQSNANAATRDARERLQAQAIGYVVAQDDGAIIECFPNETTSVLHPALSASPTCRTVLAYPIEKETQSIDE